ncbi:MAG: T9SS type A sorting domain-containing protein [Haliscomenobacter sp.]|nr:T9SS type A sorting domain-containing protein [Haliscomenobacter sp.]
MFPADLEGDCSNLRDTANVIDGGELSCDVLAVNVTDKRYNGATLNGAPVAECYKIFRTFTVINWCQYDERCGEPMQYAIVVPRDPNDNGTNWDDAGGVNVLVRDKDMDGDEEIYYEDEDGTVAYPNDEVNWANQGPKTVSDDDVYWYDERGESYPKTCAYASYGNNGDEYFAFMYTQYIFVHDQVRPEVLDPSEQVFYQNKNTCSSTVAIEFAAQDLCSGATEVQQIPGTSGNLAIERVKLNGGELPSFLTVTPAHALNGDDKGTNAWVVTGTGDASQLPIGDHKLTVIVRDDCGNLSLAKDIPFSIKDTNGIAPICYHGLSTDLMKDPDTGEGAMAVWATDFKASDVADCNAKTVGVKENIPDNQYYVVKDSGADGIADGVWDSHDGLNEAGIPIEPATSVIFDCDDAKVTQVAVRLYTKDALGNWAWCETYAIVTDGRKVCPSAAASAAIGGAITTENKESVEGVEVALSGHSSVTKMTGRDGEFGFSGVTLGYDYSVTPHLDKNPLNGVSTFDLVLITKHILGVQPLNSAYKLIAADVNNSRSVTTLDLIQLRKLILGIDTKYASNTSWRFVDRSFKFTDPSNPWKSQFPEVANLNDLAADAKANFVAVKVGDVNGNAVANSIVRTAGTFELKAEDQELKAGNEYRIAFTGDVSPIEGYQFTLGLDPNKVDLVDIEYGVSKADNFGVFAKEGMVTASWNALLGVLPPAPSKGGQEELFTLVVKAKADVASLSEVMNLNSRITAAEAYRQDGDYLSVSLALTLQRPNASTLFALEQNTPNPFAGETVIGFTLPAAGEATLTIQDVTGRTLRVVKGQFAQGHNQVTVKASDLNTTGVLSYTLKAGEYTATKKMIILE